MIYAYLIFQHALRTKSSQLVAALQNGQSVQLIHRSKVIGEVEPKQQLEEKPMTKERIQVLKKLIKDLNLPHISYKERERIYRKHLMEKYGKGIS